MEPIFRFSWFLLPLPNSFTPLNVALPPWSLLVLLLLGILLALIPGYSSRCFLCWVSAKYLSPPDFICQPNSCFLYSCSVERRIPAEYTHSIPDCCSVKRRTTTSFLLLISSQPLFFSWFFSPPFLFFTYFLIMASICLPAYNPTITILIHVPCPSSLPQPISFYLFQGPSSGLLLSFFLLIFCFPTYCRNTLFTWCIAS